MSKGKITITELKNMNPKKKLTVYAGGQVKQMSVKKLLELKQAKAKKDREERAKRNGKRR